MKVDQAGLHFMNHFQMYLKLKLIILLDTLEQNIIVKNVEHITVISLMMVQNPLAKGIVITVFVSFLKKKSNNLF